MSKEQLGIVIYPDMETEIMRFKEPLFESVGKVIGGRIENVYIRKPHVMIVDEAGVLKGKPVNPIASVLYGYLNHNCPIRGTVVIMKEGWTEDGPDIVGLTEQEIEQFMDGY